MSREITPFEAIRRPNPVGSGCRVDDHFVEFTGMVEIGKGGQRALKTVTISR